MAARVSSVSSERPACSRSSAKYWTSICMRFGACDGDVKRLSAPRAYSSGVLTLSSARRSSGSSSGAAVDQEFARATAARRLDRRRALRPLRAPRWRTAVPAGRRGRCDTPWPRCAGVAFAQQVGERGVRQKRQVAGEHQPRDLAGARRAPSEYRDRPVACRRNPRSADRWARVGSAIWSARTDTKTFAHVPARQLERPVELALAAVLERGLVATHARARAAGEHRVRTRALPRPRENRGLGQRGSRRCLQDVTLLPPSFASSRMSPITMSCDKRLAHVVDRSARRRWRRSAPPSRRPVLCAHSPCSESPPCRRRDRCRCGSSRFPADDRTESARGCAWRP